MPIDSFFICEVVEIVKLLEKMKDRLKFEHELQYIAICNALGKNFSKNYKYFDIFEKKENKKKEVTQIAHLYQHGAEVVALRQSCLAVFCGHLALTQLDHLLDHSVHTDRKSVV